MTVRTIFGSSGQTYKLGRKPPALTLPLLHLRSYMAENLPSPPVACDYTTQAAAALSQMYNNDLLGDCVVAAIEHVEGVLTGNANGGSPLIYTQDQTLATYAGACGYVPGQPNTDNGCDIQQTLQYWGNTGVPASSTHKIAGWLAVDATNVTEIQTALWLFENLIFGVDLPDAWLNPIPQASGFVWGVAGQPDYNNGHCFPGLAYDATGVTISTWAMLGKITYPAIAAYASASAQGELYTVISQDQLNKATGLAPNGFDWSTLKSDFALLGTVNPSPAPSPSPTPPSPSPTPPAALLAQLETDMSKLLSDMRADYTAVVQDLAALVAVLASK